MADDLVFKVKFDLQKGVDEALKDGDKALERIEKLFGKHPITIKLRMDNRAARGASSELTGFRKQLVELTQQWNSLTAAERGSAAGTAVREKFRALRTEAQGYTSTLQAAVKAEDKMRESHSKTAASANKLSSAYHNQSGYIDRLIKRMAVYASFRYASQFLTNIREVTAQFELQRISLGAIIQDQQKANQIFAEIKSFALTSPLKILDLTKYAKQVAAYGFAADRVFDVTKRLADISVGLGVDMGRLTLAVSQIKAATVLKSSELRQLTETGLPMLDLLSKKLTETQGKLVSAADVMDLISKRAISYEMVEEVLYDLTDAGGMFYNMQVKQSQTLFGMWSKLGDAAAIMYDQIGNTSSINAGMKLAIRSIEQMMRNWKTTARVLDSVAVAMTVYIVGLKNATVASKALTAVESLALLTTKQRIIATPKLVAAIIGQNAATKLSTNLTMLHTGAMMRQATATTVLSRGFWKLTAAMLANPWVAAASGIALIATALFHFIGNTETAAERAEKLNESVAALKSTESTTKPLIEAYTELSNKTERTAEEQRKLSDVTQELAKRFPDAVVGVNKFNNEITISIGKVQKLAGLMRDVSEKNARNNLEKSEADLEMLQNLLVKYDKFLKLGGGSFYDADKGETVFGFWLSESDKKKIVARMAEITGQINTLNTDVINAKRELGDLPKEETENIEKFGAWKKKLTEFSKYVGGVKVKLFDDSTIDQFGTLEEALDAAAKKYKEAAESVEKYNKTLESKLLTKDQIDKIAAERDEAQAMKDLSEEALNYYNAMALLLKVMGGGRSGQSDPRLGILREMASTLKQVNKEYDELAKKEGATKALADTQDKYANTFKYLQSLATKYKFELPDFGVPTDAASLTKYLDAVKEAMKKLPKSEKAVLSLETDIADINMADAQKKIEAKLKRLADRISRTKTAKEFYEKILSQTGDKQLALNLTTSIYGENGQDLKGQVVNQIRTALGDTKVELPAGIIDAENNINYKELRKFAEKAKETKTIGENVADELIKIADNGEKELSRIAQEGAKLLLKYDEIAQQRVNIEQEASNQIKVLRKAEALYLASNASEAEKTAYSKRTNKAVAGVEADKDLKLLKLQDEYLRFFSAIHSLTNKEAEALRTKVREALFKAFQSGAISADELKRELKAVDEQFQKLIDDSGFAMDYLKGGFDGLIQRLKDTADEVQSVAAEISKMESPDQISEGQKSFINKILGKFGDKTTGSNFADLFSKTNGNLKEMGGLLGNVSGKIGGMANSAGSALAVVDMIIKAVDSTIRGIAQIRDQLNEMRSDDNQLGGGFWDAFEYLENFNKYAASGWEKLKSGDVIGAATDTISSIISIFGTAQAQRVRKANKEIKRQQELLDQLEYTYGRLEKAADKLFGRDYVNNYNQQLKNLQAQQQAYLKQAEAERSKGKKADEEKIKEYENQARETADKIKELQDDLVAHFTGSTKTDVARQMAKSWIDARASMSDTFAAIKGDYADMIKNMLVEGAAARVIENALTPVWDSMQKMLDKNDVQGAIDSLVNGMDSALNAANNGMEVLWKALEARGYDMKKLIGDTDSEYTGIAKSVAGATSEEINNVAAIGNTLMYYVSPIPRIDENLARVVALMEGKTSALPTASGVTSGAVDYTDLFNTANQHLSSLPRMERHLAEIHMMLGRVITSKGGTFVVNTSRKA